MDLFCFVLFELFDVFENGQTKNQRHAYDWPENLVLRVVYVAVVHFSKVVCFDIRNVFIVLCVASTETFIYFVICSRKFGMSKMAETNDVRFDWLRARETGSVQNLNVSTNVVLIHRKLAKLNFGAQ